MVADELCGRWGGRFVPGRGEYWHAEVTHAGRKVRLLKPTTFMNGSGLAVSQAVEEWQVPTAALLVVLDDFQIPLGALRMRPKGSDGGHNGLGSVLATFGTEEVPRLRCGIGQADMPAGGEKRAYVLSPFTTEEIPAARAMVLRAADAAAAFVASGIERAMTDHNTQ
jgi:PTH1 family peptidyl-tRNA hydrolase